MKRVRIKEPEKYIFEHQIEVRATDLNYGNHLGNDSFLKYAQEARMKFFKTLGYTELDLGGYGTIMTDCEIQFLSQGFYGDVILIKMGLGKHSKFGFDLKYCFVNTRTDKVIAMIMTGILCFSYEEHKVKKIPDEVTKKLGLTKQ